MSNWIQPMLHRILQLVQELVNRNESQKIQAILDKQNVMDGKLDRILAFLTPPPAVKFEMTITTGDKQMAKSKSSMKIDILDNGHALATIIPVDELGNATTLAADDSVPAWTSSQPLTLTPAADGLTCDIAPGSPPALVNGVIISADSTKADGVTKVHGDNSADPLNVVPGPAGSFVMSIA